MYLPIVRIGRGDKRPFGYPVCKGGEVLAYHRYHQHDYTHQHLANPTTHKNRLPSLPIKVFHGLYAGGDHIPALTGRAFKVRKKKNRVTRPDFDYLAHNPALTHGAWWIRLEDSNFRKLNHLLQKLIWPIVSLTCFIVLICC